MKHRMQATLLLSVFSIAVAACEDEPQPMALGSSQGALLGAAPMGEGAQYDRFRAFEAAGKSAYGIEGNLPPTSQLADVYRGMTESQRQGLAGWHLFGAYRGKFFRRSQQETANASNMLRVVDSRSHDERFQRTGLLNEPGCKKRTTPDEFGLYTYDCPEDPYSSGVIGLRLRPNPDFDMEKWKSLGKGDVNKAAERWLEKPRDRFDWRTAEKKKVIDVEPPYEVVMTCTVCHAAPNPVAPPKDPNNASWKNIVFALGNQFFKEGAVFADGYPKDDFVAEVIAGQHPGTSDTSRMANDHIYNPNAINAIFNFAVRPVHQERVRQYDEEGLPIYNADIKPETCDGETCEVDTYRVLKDGGDSSGPSGAALRVYLNIGACYDEFAKNMDPVDGIKHPTESDRLQTPISRRKLELECADYQRLLHYAPSIVDYLKFVRPYRLSYTEDGRAAVREFDDPVLALGRQVFAEECASCHSSKQPEFPTGAPTRADTLFEAEFATWTKEQQLAYLKRPDRVGWFKEQIQDPAFLEDNFLSDDRRYPLSLIGTNSARALGTNAAAGNVWAEYASVDVQTLPPVEVPMYDFNGAIKTSMKGPVGRGYYRTPSLWGVWTSAPFLHNNSLGAYGGSVSVAGRLASYQDAAEQLLGLRARETAMYRTQRFTALTNMPLKYSFPGLDLAKIIGIPVPPGTPIALVANLEPSVMAATGFGLDDMRRLITDGPAYLSSAAQRVITVFDPVENKGHAFGLERSEEERRALIELLKTF
jgi:cytochrome c5